MEVQVCGEFCSPENDTYAIFGVIGVIHHGRSNQRDMGRAFMFVKELSRRGPRRVTDRSPGSLIFSGAVIDQC